MFKRISFRTYTTKRAVTLAVVGLASILGSVVLMNLQTRTGSTRAAARMQTTARDRVLPATPAAIRAPDTDHGGSTTARQAGHPQTTADVAPGSLNLDTQAEATVTGADLDYLRAEKLVIPVAGVNASQLRDTFTDSRSEGRHHDAIDIAAPQDTAVIAAADGSIARLFNSRLGGTTLYELDNSRRFIFYYAHLSRYGDGIVAGSLIKKGQVIAYVGDTGNAGAGNFHLHFAISKVSTPGKCYGGEAINPYPLLGGSPLGG